MDEPLGELQLQVIRRVWQRGGATVAEVREDLLQTREIAYTTVLTTLQGLERRGMLTHETVGKAYRYLPVVSRSQYARRRVGKLIDDLFDGSPRKLLTHLLGEGRVKPDELAELRGMLDAAENSEDRPNRPDRGREDAP
jgi:predicted transcriptional regulator